MKRADYTAPIDTRDPAYIEDPYPFFERVRAAGPIHRDSLGIWWVTGFADVKGLLLDKQRISRDPRNWQLYPQIRPYLADTVLERTVEQWLLTLDPPAHTRLRALVQKAFTASAAAALRARVEAVADELIDGLRGQSRFDLMAGFAQPLPVRVICDLLGLPAADYASTKAWSDLLVWVLEPSAPWAKKHEANRACSEMLEYLRAQVAAARTAPRDDLLHQLIEAQEMHERLTEDELLANLVLLFLAGHETTTNLIGNGLLALLRHPAQLARLREDPSQVETAIEELLRYDGPVTLLPRVVAQPIEIAAQTLRPGELLHLVMGAAHRDPAVFADPGRLDVTRSPNPHLAFGAGLHYCVGAPLARIEAAVALRTLLRTFPSLAVAAGGAKWRTLTTLRGLETLELEVASG
jgi:pimeloyl-[acyl-carrier protein] synthase